jgi:beta-carotene hydroxylase
LRVPTGPVSIGPVDASRRGGFSGLRYAADIRALGFLSLQTVLMAILWVGWVHSWILLYVVGWLAVSAANVKHNHMHKRTFRSAWLNIGLDHWVGLLTGTTATSIISEHNQRHHGHSNSEDDFVRASLVGYRSQWLNVLCFFPKAIYELYVRKPLDFPIWWRCHRRLFWRALAEQMTLWGAFGVLLYLNWRATLLCFLLPWIFGQWWLITFNLLHHQALDQDDPWQNSRNLVNHWTNYLFFNAGYHTAHHLRPTLHWSELPAFHDRHVAPRIDFRLVSDDLWIFYRDWFTRSSFPPNRPAGESS